MAVVRFVAYTIVIAVLLFAVAGIMLGIALLTQPLVSHSYGATKSEWFKSLTQPGTGYSCCDIADCRPTEAVFQGGHWWAKLGDKLVAVPDEIVLDVMSYDGKAYLCAYAGTLRCFVRPGGGA